MKKLVHTLTSVAIATVALHSVISSQASDWPQWRGPNRDAKALGFTPPKTWPKELTRKWSVNVGEGVSTPALANNRLYVFSRENDNEVTRCLDAATGKELWREEYGSLGASGPASRFSGPRSSPVVADGKIVTLGVRGVLSCLDASDGKKLWRKDDFKDWPRFYPASSPIVVDGLCIAQLGGDDNGALVAYDLASGDEKWKWSGDSPAYSSPVLMEVGGQKLVVAMTERQIVGVTTGGGKLAWETPFAPQGRGGYNAATPIVDGQTLIYTGSGRGVKAVKIEKDGDRYSARELWSNPDNSVQFNTPVLKDGLLYGLTQGNDFFCINTENGKTAWTAPVSGEADAGGGGGRRRGGRGGGYGSIVDAGSVLLALTPGAELIVFEPSDKELKKVASYKVGSNTYAYPVPADNGIYVKDQDTVTLWTIE